MTASSPSAARAAVDQLEGMLAKATPGPWEHVVDHHQRGQVDHSLWSDGAKQYLVDGLSEFKNENDLALIVAMHTALPGLLAALRAASDLADELKCQGKKLKLASHQPDNANLSKRMWSRGIAKSSAADQLRAALALAAVDATETAK